MIAAEIINASCTYKKVCCQARLGIAQSVIAQSISDRDRSQPRLNVILYRIFMFIYFLCSRKRERWLFVNKLELLIQ